MQASWRESCLRQFGDICEMSVVIVQRNVSSTTLYDVRVMRPCNMNEKVARWEPHKMHLLATRSASTWAGPTKADCNSKKCPLAAQCKDEDYTSHAAGLPRRVPVTEPNSRQFLSRAWARKFWRKERRLGKFRKWWEMYDKTKLEGSVSAAPENAVFRFAHCTFSLAPDKLTEVLWKCTLSTDVQYLERLHVSRGQ